MVGPAWVAVRRARYRAAGREIDGADRAVLARYFGAALLDSVRVAVVDRIENVALYGLMKSRRFVPLDLTLVSGMAFDDTVVMTRGAWNGPRRMSTLFHELVHVAQYRRLGVRGFCREYVRGWLKGGYFGCWLEEEAYEMQGRFDGGEEFVVDSGR